MTLDWKTLYVFCALAVSLFLGIFATRIWQVSGPGRLWQIYQAWFNFFGSLAGWTAGYYVVLASQSRKLEWVDLAVGAFAVVGMSGYLPASINASAAGIAWLAQKYAGGPSSDLRRS